LKRSDSKGRGEISQAGAVCFQEGESLTFDLILAPFLCGVTEGTR